MSHKGLVLIRSRMHPGLKLQGVQIFACVLAGLLGVHGAQGSGGQQPAGAASQSPAKQASLPVRHHSLRGGFTGPQVPPLPMMLGDYCLTGLKTATRQTDVPRLMTLLKQMGVTDYMHLVWREASYPHAWDDFKAMAPEFQRAGIRLWLYLTPPSEKVPEPFGSNYVRWATECALVAKDYPAVRGITIDDFNGNTKTFTPAYCKTMMAEAHKICPELSLLVICYYGYAETALSQHVQEGAIDGLILPYYHPHRNHSVTATLYPQAVKYRAWLDEQTRLGGWKKQLPLILMVYGSKVRKAPDSCTPEYVRECLREGLRATREGYADGVITYCLPKDDPRFVHAAKTNYLEWRQSSPPQSLPR